MAVIKNKTNDANRKYWSHVEEVAKEVGKWPRWMNRGDIKMTYYNRYRRYPSKPQVRSITVKYAGQCLCCGGTINAGQIADYYPVGTIAGVNKSGIAHLKAMEGNSQACAAVLKAKQADKGLNDYAGDGLDTRWEDSCRDITGA